MLQHQLGLSRTLESLLRKRAIVDNHGDGVVASNDRIQCDMSIGMLYVQFVRDIQRVYHTGMERIFTGSTWTQGVAEIGRMVIHESKPEVFSACSTVEITDTRHIPFDYERVVAAAWKCALEPFVEHDRLLESYGSADDRIAIKYRAATPANMARGDLLTAVLVLQKYVEPDRTLHVWRTMSSATEQTNNVFERAFSDEPGWVIVENVPKGVSGFDAGTAVVRMVAKLTPLGAEQHDG